MRTAMDAQPDTLDPSERTFVHAIQEHGWYRTEVSNDAEGPGFSYTTGLWFTQQQPELIVFSMNGETAHKVFWSVFNDARNGRALSAKTRTDAVFGNSAAYAFSVAKRHYAQLLGWSRWFYGGDDFPCLQSSGRTMQGCSLAAELLLSVLEVATRPDGEGLAHGAGFLKAFHPKSK